jgi:hypothetical protein
MWANNQVNTSLSGQTGTGKFVGNTSPEIVTAIEDANGNVILGLDPQASAVNYLDLLNAPTMGNVGLVAAGSDTNIGAYLGAKGTGNVFLQDGNGNSVLVTDPGAVSAANYIAVGNAASGSSPYFAARGVDSDISLSFFGAGLANLVFGSNNNASLVVAGANISQANFLVVGGGPTGYPATIASGGTDTNINVTINATGTGGVQSQGSTGGSYVPGGYIGEIISSTILSGSAVSCGATGVATDMTSIELTAGNWTIEGNVYFDISTVSGNSIGSCWISTTSATAPDNAYVTTAYGVGGYNNIGNGAATTFLSITTTTRVYISGACTYASGSPTMCGGIYATRLP